MEEEAVVVSKKGGVKVVSKEEGAKVVTEEERVEVTSEEGGAMLEGVAGREVVTGNTPGGDNRGVKLAKGAKERGILE